MEKGRQLSAAQFLEKFLFDRSMHYNFVHKLSGGEKRRLKLMTVLMANPNFLILDEPTNDLDIFVMSVLEEYLRTFEGCLIVVSHDRYFMDKMVDHLFVFEGKGAIKDIIGNYTEYRKQTAVDYKKDKEETKSDEPKKEVKVTQISNASSSEPKRKLSFKEKQEFEAIEKEIPQLEQEKEALTLALSDGSLAADEIIRTGEKLAAVVASLEEKELRWLELSEFV